MFFFIGGVQPRTVCLDKRARSCPVCSHTEVYLKRVDRYLSLFFIPIFPVKKGVPFFFCDNCKTVLGEKDTPISGEQRGRIAKCPYCGRSLEEDFNYCPRCGRRIVSS
jgi:RNA polymerase subunit RPABC4/transcription elongation factor Spt4